MLQRLLTREEAVGGDGIRNSEEAGGWKAELRVEMTAGRQVEPSLHRGVFFANSALFAGTYAEETWWFSTGASKYTLGNGEPIPDPSYDPPGHSETKR